MTKSESRTPQAWAKFSRDHKSAVILAKTSKKALQIVELEKQIEDTKNSKYYTPIMEVLLSRYKKQLKSLTEEYSKHVMSLDA